MNYYKQQHELYCGIDLHAKRMYACVVDHVGEIQFHQNLKTRVRDLTALFSEFPDRDFAVGVESTYNWYLPDNWRRLRGRQPNPLNDRRTSRSSFYGPETGAARRRPRHAVRVDAGLSPGDT